MQRIGCHYFLVVYLVIMCRKISMQRKYDKRIGELALRQTIAKSTQMLGKNIKITPIDAL